MVKNMTQKPLVSVVVIFFNAKKKNFFEEAIESILAQTYDTWELFLADDGSTDESSAIAKQYVRKYPDKVHYVEHAGHANRGMSATRNLGIRHAQGDYVAFLDADDVWVPNKLEEQVALLESYPEAAMLYGKTQFWFSWSDNNPVHRFSLDGSSAIDPMTITSIEFDKLIFPYTQLLIYLKDRNIYPCSCSMIMRRHIFEELGGFEEEFRNANEDMVFHSKVFLKFPVYVSSQCWDRYRIHPDSYWRTAWKEGIGQETEMKGRLNYLNWLEQYLGEQQVKDPQVWKALNRALMPYRKPSLYRLISLIRRLKKKLAFIKANLIKPRTT